MRKLRTTFLDWVTELMHGVESFAQGIRFLIQAFWKWLYEDTHFGGKLAPHFNVPAPASPSPAVFFPVHCSLGGEVGEGA